MTRSAAAMRQFRLCSPAAAEGETPTTSRLARQRAKVAAATHCTVWASAILRGCDILRDVDLFADAASFAQTFRLAPQYMLSLKPKTNRYCTAARF
jgi:hypothetical protein